MTVERVKGLLKSDGSPNPALKFTYDSVRWGGVAEGLVTQQNELVITREDLDVRQDGIDNDLAGITARQADLDAEIAKLTSLWGLTSGGPVTL